MLEPAHPSREVHGSRGSGVAAGHGSFADLAAWGLGSPAALPGPSALTRAQANWAVARRACGASRTRRRLMLPARRASSSLLTCAPPGSERRRKHALVLNASRRFRGALETRKLTETLNAEVRLCPPPLHPTRRRRHFRRHFPPS